MTKINIIPSIKVKVAKSKQYTNAAPCDYCLVDAEKNYYFACILGINSMIGIISILIYYLLCYLLGMISIFNQILMKSKATFFSLTLIDNAIDVKRMNKNNNH